MTTPQTIPLTTAVLDTPFMIFRSAGTTPGRFHCPKTHWRGIVKISASPKVAAFLQKCEPDTRDWLAKRILTDMEHPDREHFCFINPANKPGGPYAAANELDCVVKDAPTYALTVNKIRKWEKQVSDYLKEQRFWTCFIEQARRQRPTA